MTDLTPAMSVKLLSVHREAEDLASGLAEATLEIAGSHEGVHWSAIHVVQFPEGILQEEIKGGFRGLALRLWRLQFLTCEAVREADRSVSYL